MTNPRDKLRDGLLEPRALDQFDNSGVATVMIVEPDPSNPGRTRPATAQGGGSGGGEAAAPGIYLDPNALHTATYTPTVDGTLLIQNLCRECYLEGYTEESAPPIQAAPNIPPIFTCAPQSWAAVPVEGGVAFSVWMNGASEPSHLNEVRLVFLPGVSQLAAGPMKRHAAANTFAPEVIQVGAVEVGLNVAYESNRALVIVTAGAARIGLGSAATAPSYAVGEGVELNSAAQLAALRLIQSGGAATVRVDYWSES